jgi:hypothetical protein
VPSCWGLEEFEDADIVSRCVIGARLMSNIALGRNSSSVGPDALLPATNRIR